MREFTKIIDDRIEFLDSRFYQHADGNFYPSVTTILDAYPKSYAFYEWVKKVGEDADEIRDEAGRKGSSVHQLCENYDNEILCEILNENGNPQFKQIEWAMFERYVEFRDRFPQFELIANEVHYISPGFGFAGTLDRIFEQDHGIGKTRILVDLKTSNALHNHFWLQMAAYVQLWNEVNPKMRIDEIAILWLNAKTRTNGTKTDIQGTGWQLKRPEQSIEYYWNLFQSVYKVWQEENGGMKPRNASYQLTHKIGSNGTEKITGKIRNI